MNRKRKSTRFVVDATVVRAAGKSERPSSSACRAFLETTRRVCHRVVLTPEVGREWDRHQSLFSKQWRASMTSLRKVDGLDPGDNETLREMIATRVKVDGERRQVQKDAHLIEAALEADRVVVSLDDRARRAFDKLAPHSGSLCSVSWIDRVRDRERLDAWMDGSSPAAKHWRLGELT